MWWKLGSQLLAAVSLILVAALDYKWSDKRTRKFRRLRLTLFVILALLLGVSAVSVFVDQREATAQNQTLLERFGTMEKAARKAGEDSAARDAASMDKIAELRGMLEPFIVEARRRNPSLSDPQALLVLARRLAAVEERAERADKQTADQRKDLFHVTPVPGGIRLDSPEGAVSRHYGVGLEAYKASRLEDARAEFELVLSQAPQHVPSLNMLGIVLNELGLQAEALARLQKAFDLSKDPDILNNIEIVKRFPGKRVRSKEKPQ